MRSQASVQSERQGVGPEQMGEHHGDVYPSAPYPETTRLLGSAGWLAGAAMCLRVWIDARRSEGHAQERERPFQRSEARDAGAAERWDVGKRIRDVEEGPDGSLWMLEDANPGALIHVTPK